MRLLITVLVAAFALPAFAQEVDQERRIEKLAALLGEPGNRSHNAGLALAAIGAPALPTLVEKLESPNKDVRWQSAWTLANMNAGAAPAVAALIHCLEDGNMDVRHFSAIALGSIGAEAESAVPALILAMETSKGVETRGAIEWALNEIGAACKQNGIVHWWVVPRVFRYPILIVVALLGCWFVLLRRYPRRLPNSPWGRAALFGFVVVPPAFVACIGTFMLTHARIAPGYLRSTVVTVVPFSLSAPLTGGLLCVVPAAWSVFGRSINPAPADRVGNR